MVSDEKILRRLNNLEQKIEEQNEKLDSVVDLRERYMTLCRIIDQYGFVSPSVINEISGEHEEEIVRILLKSDSCNISTLTDRLRERYGSSSRRTTKKKLKQLKNRGVVRELNEGRGRAFQLTDRIVKQLAQKMGVIG